MAVTVSAGLSETGKPMRRLDQTHAVVGPDSHAQRLSAIVAGDEHNPFSFLGMHEDPATGELVVRVFHPGARRVAVLKRETGDKIAELVRAHAAGLFAGVVARGSDRFPYRLQISLDTAEIVVDDPYAFSPVLGELDLYLHAEGNYLRAFEKMGAHPIVLEGVSGTNFAVWAPNARRVSVVGDFNAWDGRRHLGNISSRGGPRRALQI
jgi:1,4-alpha-glucan branching enzyme